MPRKRIDEDFEATKARIKSAMKDAEFHRAFDSVARRWKARGYPDLYWEERDSYWDEQHLGVIYRGLYYELRDLCDRYGLWWLKDGGYLIRLLYAQKEGISEKNVLQPNDCPPAQHWRWFRMARTGLGLPRKHELAKAQQYHKLRFLDGLTLDVIAELFTEKEKGISVGTVRNAINNCKRYLEKGADFRHIGELAGLTDEEAFRLFLFHHAVVVRNENAK